MGEMKLEDVKAELDRTRDELERSQLQWYQLLIDLEQSQSELSSNEPHFKIYMTIFEVFSFLADSLPSVINTFKEAATLFYNSIDNFLDK